MHTSNLAEAVSGLAPEDWVSRTCRTHSNGHFRSYDWILALCCTAWKAKIAVTYSDQVSNVGLFGCQRLAMKTMYKVRHLDKVKNLPGSILLTCLITEQSEYLTPPEEGPFIL